MKELAKRLVVDQVEHKRTAENLVYSLLTEEGKPQKTLKIGSYLPISLFEMIWTAIRGLNRSNLAGNEGKMRFLMRKSDSARKLSQNSRFLKSIASI